MPKHKNVGLIMRGGTRRRIIAWGLVLTVVHMGVAWVSLVVAAKSLARTLGNPSAPPETGFEKLAEVLLSVLWQPGMSIWTPWMSQHTPNAVETVLFCLNSALWGFGVALLLSPKRRRKRRTQRHGRASALPFPGQIPPASLTPTTAQTHPDLPGRPQSVPRA